MTQSSTPRGMLKPVFKGLLMLALLGLAAWLLEWAGNQGLLTGREWFDSHIRGQGLAGVFLYVGVTALFTGVGVPRQFLCFIGGYVYGFAWGTLLGTLGSALGCILCLGFARFFARDFVLHRFGRRVARVDAFLRRSPFRMALMIRFFPAGSNLAVNLLAGVSSIAIWPFLLGSTVGYLPQTAIFALFGSGVEVSSGARIVVSVALFLAATALGIALYRRHRAEAAGAVEEEGNGGEGA